MVHSHARKGEDIMREVRLYPGERIDDLQKFDADQFVNALFDVKKSDL